MGIKGASSMWCCPWCLADKHNREFIDMDWENYPRSWISASECFKCQNNHKLSCYKNEHDFDVDSNLLKDVFEPNNVVLDVLHMTLRTSEILEGFLFDQVGLYSLQKELQQQPKNLVRFHVLAQSYVFLAIKTAIPLTLTGFDEEIHVTEWSTLNAEQKVNLWKSIDLEQFFHNVDTAFSLAKFSEAIEQ